jgi:hypothetical protein
MKFKPNSTNEAWPGASALINLVPLLMPPAPTFPRFSELIGEPERPGSPSASGLFVTLLGSPEVLLHDYLDSPSKYQNDILPLLQDLVSENRKIADLNAEEMQALDRATIDYNAQLPPKAAPQTQEAAMTKTAEAELMYDDPRVIQPESLTDAPAYWWLNGDSL